MPDRYSGSVVPLRGCGGFGSVQSIVDGGIVDGVQCGHHGSVTLFGFLLGRGEFGLDVEYMLGVVHAVPLI